MSAWVKGCLFLLWSAAAYAETSTLYTIVGSECVEMTLNAQDTEYVKTIIVLANPLQSGTCSDHGYTVEDADGEQPVRTPFASEAAIIKTYRMSALESSKLAAQAFLSAPLSVSEGKPVLKATLGRQPTKLRMGLLDGLMGKGREYPGAVMGTEDIMSQKEHGTSKTPVQKNLRWNCDNKKADQICNFNRHYAEYAGYWERETSFLQEEAATEGEIDFYDSNTGNKLFTAPRDRSYEQFVKESRVHGWPSFRDSEVNWDYVRVLPDGEAVSIDGTHLGHNLPDSKGNRYCINLVSVAGRPKEA